MHTKYVIYIFIFYWKTKVENEKLRKYDILANEIGSIYKAKTKIIPYVITWDGLVTKYHKKYLKELDVPSEVEAYMQGLTLRKTLELISLEKRRGFDEDEREEMILDSIKELCKISSVPNSIII